MHKYWILSGKLYPGNRVYIQKRETWRVPRLFDLEHIRFVFAQVFEKSRSRPLKLPASSEHCQVSTRRNWWWRFRCDRSHSIHGSRHIFWLDLEDYGGPSEIAMLDTIIDRLLERYQCSGYRLISPNTPSRGPPRNIIIIIIIIRKNITLPTVSFSIYLFF